MIFLLLLFLLTFWNYISSCAAAQEKKNSSIFLSSSIVTMFVPFLSHNLFTEIGRLVGKGNGVDDQKRKKSMLFFPFLSVK